MTDQMARQRRMQQDGHWFGRLAGAIAMVGMLAVFVLGRSMGDPVSLLDALADALLLAMPLSVFSWLLDLFGQQAKTLLLVGLVLLFLLGGAWLGGRFMRQAGREPGGIWQQATMMALVLFLCTAGFVVLFVDSQSPEILSGGGFTSTAIVLGIGSVVFAASLAMLARFHLRPDAGTSSAGRRRLLTWSGVAIAVVFGIIPVAQEVGRVARRKTNMGATLGVMPPAITPIEDFYVISKNFVDPEDNRGPEWSITIDGLVDREMTLKRTDLEAMGTQEFISTQLCISNPIGGGLIGTAEWTGVPLHKVLGLAGLGEGAFKVIFEGTDGYTTAVPVDRVMQPESHIVWGMNDEPLPREHGIPVRAIIPGLYGMKSVKWLTRMTVTSDDYLGYWEVRNWTDSAVVKTMSRIDVPIDHEVLPTGSIEIGGIAFGGDRGVGAVEVSTDDGRTWREAAIREAPNPDGVAWVLWTLAWDAGPGAYAIVIRAVDRNGDVQTPQETSQLPDGASGWHRITVGVT